MKAAELDLRQARVDPGTAAPAGDRLGHQGLPRRPAGRTAREEREWSRDELAQRAKVSAAVVESAERGIRPEPNEQAALLRVLEIEGANPWRI